MLTDDGKHLYVSWDEYHMLIERLALKVHNSGWAFDQIPVSYTHLDVYKRQGSSSTRPSVRPNNAIWSTTWVFRWPTARA